MSVGEFVLWSRKKLVKHKAKENKRFQLRWSINLIMTVLLSGGGAANENSNDKEGDKDVTKGD